MNPLRLLTLLALLTLASGALAGDDSLTLFSLKDGKTKLKWVVSMARLQKTPAWRAASGRPPPLSIAKAVAIATRQLKAENPAFQRYKVMTISLVTATWLGNKAVSRWYYKIELVPVVDGGLLDRLNYVAVVLLDGTMVEQQVEQDEKR